MVTYFDWEEPDFEEPQAQKPELDAFGGGEYFDWEEPAVAPPTAPQPTPSPRLQHVPIKPSSLFEPGMGGIAAPLIGAEEEEFSYGQESVRKQQEREQAKADKNRTMELLWEGGRSLGRALPEAGLMWNEALRKMMPESMAEETLEIPGIPEAEGIMDIGTRKVSEGYQQGRLSPELQHPEDFRMPEGIWESFLFTMPQVVGQAAATAVGGHALGALAMFGQIAGGQYSDLIDQGVDENRAMAMSIVNGLVQAPLEQIGMKGITKAWQPKIAILKRLKNILKSAGTEGLTEFLQKYPEEITTMIAKNPGSDMAELGKEVLNNMWEWTKEGLTMDMPVGMLMGAVMGSPGLVTRAGRFDPDTVPTAKDKRGTLEKVGDWLRDTYNIEAQFDPQIPFLTPEEQDLPVKRTKSPGAKETEFGGRTTEPLRRKPEEVVEKAKIAEKLTYKPAKKEEAFVRITEAAQRAIQKREVDEVFMDALAETIEEESPKVSPTAKALTKPGPKTTQPQRLVTPQMVERAEQKARSRRVEADIKKKGESYEGEALVDTKTGLPFKTEAQAKVAITRFKQENPKYKNWEWEVVPAKVNVNEGFGLKPVRPMKRTAAIVRNALRKDPQAKIGDIYRSVKDKAPEEKATRQDVAKLIKQQHVDVPSSTGALETELKKLGKKDFQHKYNPLNLEAGLVKKLTDAGVERSEAKKRVRASLNKYAKLYNQVLAAEKKLEAKPSKVEEKPAAKPLKAKVKKPILGTGVKVQTEEGLGQIVKKTGPGQWDVKLLDGEDKGEIFPYGEEELEAPGHEFTMREAVPEIEQLDLFGDTIKKAVKEAEDAIDALNETWVEGDITTHGIGITVKIKRGKALDIRGYKIANQADAANVFQVFRDPRLESGRVIYLKKGVIVHQTGVTAGLPGQTPSHIDSNKPAIAKHLRDNLKLYGADQIIVTHNHPSGNATPSDADVQAFEGMHEYLNKNGYEDVAKAYQYEIVIDSGKFGIVEMGGRGKGVPSTQRLKLPENWQDPLMQPTLPSVGLKTIEHKNQAAGIARNMGLGKGTVAVMFLDADLRIRVIQEIPTKMFDKRDGSLENHLKKVGKDHGAPIVYLYTNKYDESVWDKGIDLIKHGYIGEYFYNYTEPDTPTLPRLRSLREAYRAEYETAKRLHMFFGEVYRPSMKKVLRDIPLTKDNKEKLAEEPMNLELAESGIADKRKAWDVSTVQARVMSDELGVGITTPTADGRYARGNLSKQDTVKVVVDKLIELEKDKNHIFEVVETWDGAKTVEEIYEFVKDQMVFLDPVIVEDKKGVRWQITKMGTYGNDKMKFANLTYPNGRNTYDFQGCGRKGFFEANGLLNLWHPLGYVGDKACYGGACYAEAILKGNGGANATIAGGVMVQGSTSKTKEMRDEISKYVARHGVLEARKKYPDFQINWFGDSFKVQKHNPKKNTWRTVRKFNSEEEARAYFNGRGKGDYRIDVEEGKGTTVGEIVNLPGPARVTTLLGPAKGQDIRLGVDTDGGAWIVYPEVMDALLKTGANKFSIYSSAYHQVPPKHKLSEKSIINVTISGYHPLPETLKRLEWAKAARDNGWTVILREVTADHRVFTKAEMKLYNRIHEALLETDFLIMEQPLHKGSAKSKPGESEFGLPGCCKGSKANPNTCDQCEVAEGQGQRFQKFWGMKEGSIKAGKLVPDAAEWEHVKKQAMKTDEPDFDTSKAQGTARGAGKKGAVGMKAVVPKTVVYLGKLKPGMKVLDFGAGKGRPHADQIEAATGAKVNAYDFSLPGSKAFLTEDGYDLIYASNVLNTQQIPEDPTSSVFLKFTTNQFIDLLERNPGAEIIANFPSEPRHTPSIKNKGEAMQTTEMTEWLEKHFEVRKLTRSEQVEAGIKSAADIYVLAKKGEDIRRNEIAPDEVLSDAGFFPNEIARGVTPEGHADALAGKVFQGSKRVPVTKEMIEGKQRAVDRIKEKIDYAREGLKEYTDDLIGTSVAGKFLESDTRIARKKDVIPELERRLKDAQAGVDRFKRQYARGQEGVKQAAEVTDEPIIEKTIDDVFKGEDSNFRKTLKKTFKFLRNWKTHLVDKYHPIKKFLGEDAYRQYRMVAGLDSLYTAFMEDGDFIIDENGNITVDPNVESVGEFFKNNPEVNDMLKWAALKRAERLEKEVVRKGKKKGLAKERWLVGENRRIVEDYLAEQGKSDAFYQELYDRFLVHHKSLLDVLEYNGLINKDQKARWVEEIYVPFHRVFENEMGDEVSGSPYSTEAIGSKLKELEGAEIKLGDPLQNVLSNWAYMLKEALRNGATVNALNTALNLQAEEKSLIVTVEKQGGDDTISFMKDGRRAYFKVHDQDLYNAMKSVNGKNLPKFLDTIFGKPKRWLTYGVTKTPAFVIANTTRDTVSAAIVEKDFIPFIDSLRGIFHIMSNSPEYIRAKAAGALFGGSYTRADNPRGAAVLAKRFRPKKGKGVVLDTPAKLWEMYEKFIDASENAARVGIFLKKTRKGMTDFDAAYAARDITDFANHGASEPVAYLLSAIPFLGARMQGNYKLFRAAKEDTIPFFMKGMALSLASLALWSLYEDDDRYKALEDWDKWTYYHFWVGGVHYKIPKPFEAGVIFSSAMETAAALTLGKEDKTFLKRFAFHAFGETLAMNPIPQVVKPAIEVWSNKSMFTGRPIEGMALKNLKPGERAYGYDSETLRMLGRGLNISPKKMQALIRGYFGNLALGVLDAADVITRTFGDFPDRPTLEAADYPALGRFIRTGPERQTKYMTKFYDALEESNQVVATIKHMKEIGDYEQARELQTNERENVRLNKRLKKYQGRLSKLRKASRAVYRNRAMTPDQKRDKLRQYQERINSIVERVYKGYLE